MNIAIIILSAVVAALAVYSLLLRKANSSAEQARAAAQEAQARAEAEIRTQIESRMAVQIELATLKVASEVEIATLRQRSAEEREAETEAREKLEETFRLQFKNLAGEVLAEQSKHFKETNRESLDVLLKPFKDNIMDFRLRVEAIYKEQNIESGSLKNELKNLMDLNRQISTEATNLTNALKGNSKKQGDWGETLLETLLDSLSLDKGTYYKLQNSAKNEEGQNQRPDVVLKLPENKQIVIDSKVSIKAFVDYSSSENSVEEKAHLDSHIRSIRKHINDLSRKKYEQLHDSPEFVIMFIPSEPAFLTALQNDPELWSEAYNKRVILSSPTNLFALLKMVADLWRRDKQEKNTQEIIKYGRALHKQLMSFYSSLEAIGTALNKAQGAYDEAHKRLRTGNNNIDRLGQKFETLVSGQGAEPEQARIPERENEFAN